MTLTVHDTAPLVGFVPAEGDLNAATLTVTVRSLRPGGLCTCHETPVHVAHLARATVLIHLLPGERGIPARWVVDPLHGYLVNLEGDGDPVLYGWSTHLAFEDYRDFAPYLAAILKRRFGLKVTRSL